MFVTEPDRARFAEVNRTRLRVWEWGDPQAPTVWCAHGAFDHGRMFDELAPLVAQEGFHVKVLDVRGHGDSGRLAHGHSWSSSIMDIGCLLAEEPEPVGLIGHSMGAGLMTQAAATWPEFVKWVVCLDSLGPPSHQFAEFDSSTFVPMAFDYLVKQLGRSYRVFPDKEAMAVQRGAINTRMPRVWLDHLVAHGSTANDGGWSWKWDPLFNSGLLDGFNPSWVIEDFKALEAPMLVLMGGEDETWSDMPQWEVEERLSHIRNHVYAAVPEAGHYVHLEQPQFVLDQIRGFLK